MLALVLVSGVLWAQQDNLGIHDATWMSNNQALVTEGRTTRKAVEDSLDATMEEILPAANTEVVLPRVG